MFKRAWLTLLPILLCAPSGCLWSTNAEHTSWLKRFNNQAVSPELAQLQVAIIERPVGDPALNHEVWENADELVCRRAILEDNGFRIGQLVGTPPIALQQMLLSSQCCTPKGMVFPPGRAMPIELGPIRATTTYQIVVPNTTSDVTLGQAGFMLDVAATFTKEGTKLTFTPKVENGEAELPFHARPDQSTWELRKGRANRQYPDMSWNVTLTTNQYLLIGGRPDRTGTLGLTMFTQPESGVQRLLVIRNCRAATSNEASDERIRSEKSTPLALQAQKR